MKTGNLFSAEFMATVIDRKVYPKGNKLNLYIELEVTESLGDYPPFEQLRNVRGERKGKIILKLQTWDYTREHENRKVDWKLAGRKGHLSKVYPLTPDKAWIDFGKLGRPDDIGLIQFDECLEYGNIKSMKIFIVENGRNDPGLIQMFRDADFS